MPELSLVSQRVVCVDDGSAAVTRVDPDLEQIEQIARPGSAAGAVGADDADVIRGVARAALLETCTIIRRLRQVNVPHRAGVVFARSRRAVIDQVDCAVVSGNPREDGGVCRSYVDDYSRSPCLSLVGRHREENTVRIRPGRVKLPIGWVGSQGREDVVESYWRRSVEDQRGCPDFTAIGAARNENMVEVRGLGLQDAGFASGIDVVDVVGESNRRRWDHHALEGEAIAILL